MSNVPYLIIGATGARFARELVQRLFCPALCHACPHCTKLAHGTHPDLIWVSKSGKRISIDQVRELHQKALYPPVEAPQKIYVIESVEDLSLEAANSLLKILEEPAELPSFHSDRSKHRYLADDPLALPDHKAPPTAPRSDRTDPARARPERL
jgi:hypothetical protein